jgi:hypothetical protein
MDLNYKHQIGSDDLQVVIRSTTIHGEQLPPISRMAFFKNRLGGILLKFQTEFGAFMFLVVTHDYL